MIQGSIEELLLDRMSEWREILLCLWGGWMFAQMQERGGYVQNSDIKMFSTKTKRGEDWKKWFRMVKNGNNYITLQEAAAALTH